MIKLTSNIFVGVLVVWVLIAILDMWFDIVSGAVFLKLSITLGLIAVVALVVTINKRSHSSKNNTDQDPSNN